jgi:hypothetical protein
MALADSAGTPWAGRHFEHNSWGNDDGSAPHGVIDAITRFHTGQAGEEEVVEALRGERLLIPLVARLGEHGVTEDGRIVDKSQELSIVTVSGPDGREVLPAFTSVVAMQAWNAKARPVPAHAERVAIAAVSEHTDLVVIDPTSQTEFVIRRPALWAIAQSEPWLPSYRDDDVLIALSDAAAREPAVREVALGHGDPSARLEGPELVIRLTLDSGLDPASLDQLLGRLNAQWSASETIALRVDSMRVQIVAAT